MSNTPFLRLLYKEIDNSGKEFYVFNLSEDSQRKFNASQSVELISMYSPKNRNCKVSRGIISLKPREGTLRTIHVSDTNLHNKYIGVRLYTGKIDRKSFTIYSNDTWFFRYTMNDVAFLKSCKNYISQIDKAEIVDYSLMQARSAKGIFSVKDLSTGLKTVLNILYLLKQDGTNPILVNATECGDKVMNILFKLVNNSKIGLYINHDILDMPEDFKYTVNGHKLDSTLDLIEYLQ